MTDRVCIAIDLKSFYASAACVRKGLDPLKTLLVVADAARSDKTICLAVSPALKAMGIPGRPRLFEVLQQMRMINAERRMRAPGRRFTGKSCNADELAANPSLEADFIASEPHLAYYMQVSAKIYSIYTRTISPDDIHVYSVDEVFIEAHRYLRPLRMTPRELTVKLIRDVLAETGITATAGIGPNLYLCKVAMDIVAKHIPADADGVRIAELTERSYREQLWEHRPITDFWRVGRATAKKLEQYGMYTMGDVALCSHTNESLLYRLFGVNAELLIDHAWGVEPCTIEQIHAYKPESSSLSSGQVFPKPFSFEAAKLAAKEMAESLSLELVERGLLTDRVQLNVNYDTSNLSDPSLLRGYEGETERDRYGRQIPKAARGGTTLPRPTSSSKQIITAFAELFDRIADRSLTVRAIYTIVERVVPEKDVLAEPVCEQLDMFTDYAAEEARREKEAAALEKERRRQRAMLDIRAKFGKNAIVRGMDLRPEATAMDRNDMIGGHKA